MLYIFCFLSYLVLRPYTYSSSIPAMRSNPLPNSGSRMQHSVPVQSPSSYPQKITSIMKGATPETTPTNHLSKKSSKFSFSAGNLDSDNCNTTESTPLPPLKSQTPKHDVSHSKDADLALMSAPTSWRGLLSVSTGNMQTHV